MDIEQQTRDEEKRRRMAEAGCAVVDLVEAVDGNVDTALHIVTTVLRGILEAYTPAARAPRLASVLRKLQAKEPGPIIPLTDVQHAVIIVALQEQLNSERDKNDRGAKKRREQMEQLIKLLRVAVEVSVRPLPPLPAALEA